MEFFVWLARLWAATNVNQPLLFKKTTYKCIHTHERIMFFINSIDQLDIVIHLLLLFIIRYPKIDSTSLELRIKSLVCTLIMIIRHVVFSHFWSPALFEKLCDFEILNPTYTIKSLGQIKTSNFFFIICWKSEDLNQYMDFFYFDT